MRPSKIYAKHITTFLFCLSLFMFFGCQNDSQNTHQKSTKAIAIYDTRTGKNNLKPEEINYTITDEKKVDELLNEVDFNSYLDGTNIGSAPNAFMYVRDENGNVTMYTVLVAWQYLLSGDKWNDLTPISKKGSELIRKNVQQ